MPDTLSNNPNVVLLCEGYDPAFVPEVAYVRQGDKVCFLRGKPTQLTESFDGQTIVESVTDLELVERENGTKSVKNGKWIVEGPFQRSDVKNANQRSYPRKIWEKWVADESSEVQKTVHSRGMIGHIEHPETGRTHLKESALLVESLKLKNDGVVWGRAELLNTPGGQILQELTKEKVAWGVSSRGSGSVDANGVVNEKDYRLTTFDAVASPSTPGAYPKPAKLPDSKTNESGVSDSNDDVVSQFVAEATKDAEAVLDESLSPAQRTALIHKMCDHFGSAHRMLSTANGKADAVHDVITKVRKRITELATPTLSESSTGQGQQPPAAFDRLAQRLQTRLTESMEKEEKMHREIATLSRRIRDLDERANQSHELASRLQADVDRLTEELKAETERADGLAESLAEATKQNVEPEVMSVVNDAIRKNSRLEQFRESLAALAHVESVTAERVVEEISKLEGLLQNTNRPVVRSNAVPQGMVVESVAYVPQRASTSPTSRGAAVASAALKNMKL